MIARWRFQPKLTLLYSVLFLIIFIPVIMIVHAAVVNGVTRSVDRELRASGAVFERILTLRGSQLEQSATVMAGDFGFRAAVATEDAATVQSALSNIIDRVGASRGFVINLDGEITASTDRSEGRHFVYSAALDEDGASSNAGVVSERPHLIVAAPIKAPLTVGWVVFALELDEAATSELETLSPVPIHAEILYGPDALTASTERSRSENQRTLVLHTQDGDVLSHFVSLPVIESSPPIALVLTHALDVAFQPYRQMFAIILLLGVVGILVLAGGSWFLAARVTRPLAALTRAVNHLKEGHRSSVQVQSQDEFAELADGFNTMSEEITAREQAITHMAMHDAETDLPNRRHLQDQLGTDIKDHSQRTVLIGVRLKRFANVRAAIGYDLAAQFLNQVAKRLTKKGDDTQCARLTADTLAVIRALDTDEDLDTYCQALRAAMSHAICLKSVSVDVNMAVGAVEISPQADTAEELVQKLELALDHADAHGLQAVVYTPQRIQDPAENLSLMSDMHAALKSGDIRLHYQPKVDTRTGHIAEVEALLRWTHYKRGFVSPDLFVEMAEETGHIAELTQWVIERALSDQHSWAGQSVDVKVGINMSGRLLSSSRFTDFVIDTVERHGAEPGKIVLEITETAVMDDPQAAIAQLHRLRDAGFTLSIDDYGTGLSSLSYLKQLPVTEIKIDKSFVLDLARNEQDRVLVRSTIDLARSLGLKITAEGVENQESYAALQLLGCDFAQGYFISKAIPSEDFQVFAKAWNTAAASAPDTSTVSEAS